MANGFSYTQAAPQSGDNFAELNQMIDQNAGRLQRAVAQDQAIKANRARQQAQELQAAQKNAQNNLKRIDGYDSSMLMPEMRPLFNDYVRTQLESVNNFATDDVQAVEKVIDNIDQFYTTYSSHLSDKSVTEIYDRTLNLASDPEALAEYESGISSIAKVDIDMNKFVEMDKRHRGGFATGYELVGNQIYATGADGYMAVEDMKAWTNPRNYEPSVGSKASRSLHEFAVGYVRESGLAADENEFSRPAALEAATSLVRTGDTDDSLEVRRRVIEDYFTQEQIKNKALVEEFLQHSTDDQGNFTGSTAKAYQDILVNYENKAISKMADTSYVNPPDEEPEEPDSDGSMTQEDVFGEVFQDMDAKFTQVQDVDTIFGGTERLANEEGRGLPYGQFYNLERMRMDRATIDIPNPLYVPEVVPETGETVYPEGMDAVIKFSPNDLVVVPNKNGGYQVLLDNISVEGSPYTKVLLDHEEDRDTLAQLDFYIKETYDKRINLETLVEKARESKERFGERARASRETTTTPARTGPMSGF